MLRYYFIVLLLFPLMLSAQVLTDKKLEQAQTLLGNEEYEKASALFEEAMNIKENEVHCLEGLVRTYSFWSWALRSNGQNGDNELSKARQYAKTLNRKYPETAVSHRSSGIVSQYGGEYGQARTYYQKAIQIDDKDAYSMYLLWSLSEKNDELKLEDPLINRVLELNPQLVEAWQTLGDINKRLNRLDEALINYKKAAVIKPNYFLYYNIGTVELELGNINNALYNFEESIAMEESFSWAYYGKAIVHINAGEWATAAADFKKAIELNSAVYPYYEQMLSQFDGLKDYPLDVVDQREVQEAEDVKSSYPQFYMEGIQAAQKKDFVTAINLLQKSKDWQEKNNYGKDILISTSAWLSHCYLELGRYERAIEVSKELLRNDETYFVPSDIASLLATIAAVYNYWGDYRRSFDYHKMSADKLVEIDNKDMLCTAYLNVSQTAFECTLYNEVINYGIKCIELCHEVTNRINEGLCYNIMARALIELGRYEEAGELLQKGLKLCDEIEGIHPKVELLLTFAAYKNIMQDMVSAAAAYNEAVELNDPFLNPLHPKNARVFAVGANLHFNSGSAKTGFQYLEMARRNYQAQIEQFFPAMAEEGKFLFYWRIMNFNNFFASCVVNYAAFYPGILGGLFNNLMNQKSLLLNYDLKRKQFITTSKSEALRSLYDKYLEQRELLMHAYQSDSIQLLQKGWDIQEIRRELDSLDVALGKYEHYLSKAKPKDWKDVKRHLKKGQAVVELFQTDYKVMSKGNDRSGVMIIALVMRADRDTLQMITLEEGSDLQGAFCETYFNYMENEVLDKKSYDRYWKEIDKALVGAKEVFVSTDGVYNLININTLYDPQKKEFVQDKYQVSYLTNSSDLLTSNRTAVKQQTASLFGYPNFRLTAGGVRLVMSQFVADTTINDLAMNVELERGITTNLQELPGTLIEVNDIYTTLKSNGWKCTVYVKDDALEDQLKRQVNPGVLHIATHGFFDEQATEKHFLLGSGLLMAGASELSKAGAIEGIDDGILTSYEAMNMHLDNTDLVVLSACETGKGVVWEGEGVYGLRRAFKIAGADNIIMSLWRVNDVATQEFMTTYYKKLIELKDYREAFFETQEVIKTIYPHPYYWGAFVFLN